MRKEENNNSLFNAIPEKVINWEKNGENNLAVLLVPRFRKGPLKKWLQPKLKEPYMKVKLDEIGTFIWERCDRKNTIQDIAKSLENEFGDRIKPVEPRLRQFFTTLYKSQFVRYWEK